MRVVLQPAPSEELVRPVFAAMRAWGHEHPTVVVASLDLARRLLRADAELTGGGDSPLSRAVREEVEALVERFGSHDPQPVDRRDVDAALQRLAVS